MSKRKLLRQTSKRIFSLVLALSILFPAIAPAGAVEAPPLPPSVADTAPSSTSPQEESRNPDEGTTTPPEAQVAPSEEPADPLEAVVDPPEGFGEPDAGYYYLIEEDFSTATLDTTNKWLLTSGIDLTTNPGKLTLSNGGKCGLGTKLADSPFEVGKIMGKPYGDSVIVEFRAKVDSFGGKPGNGTPTFGFQLGINSDQRLMMSIDTEKIWTSSSGTWSNGIVHTIGADWHTYRVEIPNLGAAAGNNPPVKLSIDGTEVGAGTVKLQYNGSTAPSLNFFAEQNNAKIQIDSVYVQFPEEAPAAPNVPTGLAIGSITTTGAAATWTAPVGGTAVAGYEVRLDNAKVGDATEAAYALTGLTAGTEYTIQVFSKSATGVLSATAAEATFTTTADANAPGAPTGLVFREITDTTATADWTAPVGGMAAAKYEVHVNGVKVSSDIAVTTLALTGLVADSTNTVKVFSKSAAHVLSATAAEASFKTALSDTMYAYIEEDFAVGNDGKPVSGLNWGGGVLRDGALVMSGGAVAQVMNFSKPYPGTFITEFRVKTDANAAEGQWAFQMQVISNEEVAAGKYPQTVRLMLKQGAGNTLKSCTSGGTWNGTINDAPNDGNWHTYRLVADKAAKTVKLFIDGTAKGIIDLQAGGYTNPMFKFWKDGGSSAVETRLDDVRLLFPVEEGAPIWTPAQGMRQTAKTYDSVTVAWDKAIGTVDNYVIYKEIDKVSGAEGEKEYVQVAEVAGTETTYTLTGLASSSGCKLRVEAQNTHGETTGGPNVEVRTKFNPAIDGMDLSPLWMPGVGNGYGMFRIPGIVVTTKDTIISYCEARRGGGDWDPMDMVIGRSTDGGDTWSETRVLIPGLEKDITVNNPVVIVDKDGKTLHLLYCVMYGVRQKNGGVYYMQSIDDGITWSEPASIGDTLFPNESTPGGAATRNVIATGPGHGICLGNGTLVVPVWMVDQAESTSTAHQPSVVSTIYSKDKGVTWHLGEIIHRNQGGMALSNPNETTAVELSDGRVMLNIRRQWGASAESPNYRVTTISPNGYSDWSQPVADTELMDAGNGCFGSLVRYDADTILFTNAEDPTNRRNVTVKASYDDGETWVAKKSLDPQKLGSTYSDIAVDSKGVIYDLVEMGGGLKLARFTLDWLTKPFAPMNAAAADITPATAKIAWERSPDNLGTAAYNIYLDNSAIPVNGETPITANSYALTNLSPATAYTARVVELGGKQGSAASDAGNAPNSDAATVTFTTVSDQAPPTWGSHSAVTATARTKNSMTLSWTAATYGAMSYKVFANGTEKGTVTAPATIYEMTGLESNTAYTIKIEAVNTHGTTDNGPTAELSTAYDIASGDITSQMLMKAGDGYSDFRIPSLVSTNTGTLLAMAEARTGGGDWSPMDAVLMRSTDGGETWSKRVILAAGAAESFACNNPVLIPTKQGPIFAVYCKEYGVASRSGGVFYIKSLDDGVTWSAPVDISASCLPEYRNVIATGPGHGIQLENGRLITAVWMVPKSAGQGDTSHHPGEVSTLYSDDMGETWHIGEIIKGTPDLSDPNESTVVELSDGRVMINMRNVTGTKQRAISISNDGATNWSTPYFDEALIEPVCFGSLVRYDDKGTLLFVNPDTTTSRTHGTIKVSYDDGKTWPVKRLLNEGNSTYADVAVSTVDGKKQISVLLETAPGNTLTLYRFPLSWVEQNTVNELKSLSLSKGSLQLEAGKYEYTVEMAAETEYVTLSARAFNDKATLTCGGNPLVNGKATVALKPGNTDVVVKVSNTGGIETSYTIHFTRKIPASQSDMVLHYTLNNLEDGLQDKTDNGNDATVTGSITAGEGKFGGGAAWGAGGNNGLATTSAEILDFGTGDFTVSMWIKPTNLNDRKLLCWYGGYMSSGWWLRQEGSSVRFLITGSGGETSVSTAANALTLNTWSHIAAVRTGTTLKIYVDGVEAASGATPERNVDGGNKTLLLGVDTAGARVFKGNMDEVKAFNYALTPAELVTLKNSNTVVSAAKDILAFSANGKNGKIEGANITLKQPTGTNLANIAPEIIASKGATVSPAGGVQQNFTVPVTYTVTAPNGTTKDYTVTAVIGENIPPVEENIYYTQPAPVKVCAAGSEQPAVKMNLLGDSITYGQDPANSGLSVKQYHAYLADELKLDNVNYGVRGSTISVLRRGGDCDPFTVRYQTMREDADIIFVYGGTNDFGVAGGAPFGTWQDTEDTTFLGGLRVLVEGLIKKYPGKQIVFMTPITRDDRSTANASGRVLAQYVTAIKNMCAEYGVPVMDAYAAPEMNLLKDKTNLIADGLHPSAAGHKVMADWIYDQLLAKKVIEVAGVSAAPDATVGGMPVKVTLPAVNDITLTAAAGANYTYQWQVKVGEAWNNLGTAQTQTIPAADVTFAKNGTKYRCTITNTEPNKTPSDVTSAELTLVTEKGIRSAPTGLTTKAPTAAGNDGKIQGLKATESYQYKPKTAADYADVAAARIEITDLAAGTYQVRLAANANYVASAPIEVTVSAYIPGAIYPTGVTLSHSALSLTVGGSALLAATVAPADATHKSVTWKSSAPDIATVDAYGRVAAASVGTSNITVTTVDGNYTATCVVSVTRDSSSSDSSGSSNTTTETEKNADGSTTKTVTDKTTGTVTATITMPNGDKTVVETKKDGTVTKKVINKDGYTGETVTRPDGSFLGKVTDADGVTVETTGTATGATTATVTLPKGTKSASVTIPTTKPTTGTVAVLVHADGTEELIRTSVTDADGVHFTADGNVKVKLVDNSKYFNDVAEAYWAADAVQFVTSRELFSGVGNHNFDPTADMSCVMLVTVLARLDGQDTTVGETWYADAVKWGIAAGITDGKNPEAAISREQLAVMLYRYAKAERTTADLSNFSDADRISAWSADAMNWAVDVGILIGSAGKLNPQGSATRAEVAAMLQRFVSI